MTVFHFIFGVGRCLTTFGFGCFDWKYSGKSSGRLTIFNEELERPQKSSWLNEAIRVASAISDMRKKTTLNREVLTNRTAQWARDIRFADFTDGCRRERLGLGFGLSFGLGELLMNTTGIL